MTHRKAESAAVNIDEVSLACPPLTSCSVAQFLTGHVAWGLGIPGLIHLHHLIADKEKIDFCHCVVFFTICLIA